MGERAAPIPAVLTPCCHRGGPDPRVTVRAAGRCGGRSGRRRHVTAIELAEGGPSKVMPLADDIGDALAASEVVNAFRVGDGQWELAANTKVGVAVVSGETLWIKPKVE